KRLKKLQYQRMNKLDDYFHKISKEIINYCLTYKIKRIIIGKNKNWKKKVNMGKKNNQKYVCVPFERLIWMRKKSS
ncbi:MAG TPA: transposase, partial [Epsilonproteobacteria bacterium]|nr:transposase [Campylobacterota bacterium]